MDAIGAQHLRVRLEHQDHWRRARAVRDGEQAMTDPDDWELEEVGDGLRLYSPREEHMRTVDGKPALVLERMTKRLVDGWWETSYEVESVRLLEPRARRR